MDSDVPRPKFPWSGLAGLAADRLFGSTPVRMRHGHFGRMRLPLTNVWDLRRSISVGGLHASPTHGKGQIAGATEPGARRPLPAAWTGFHRPFAWPSHKCPLGRMPSERGSGIQQAKGVGPHSE